MHNRVRICFAILLVFGLVLGLGCGRDEKREEKAEVPAEEVSVLRKPREQLMVGFVYVSPVGEAGWSYAHEQGRLAVEDVPGVTTSYAENIQDGPNCEQVIQDMARQGYDVIFTTSYGYMDATLKAAGQHPEIIFMNCAGYKTGPNMGAYFGRIYQARYLSGMVAGAMTKSNILGYVAAYPVPEVVRGINAFTLGARAVNPDAKVRVAWTGTWYDPAKERHAARRLMDAGADVVAQHQDSPAAQEAAQERGAYCIGYNSDMSMFAPDAHLTAPVWNWPVYYRAVIEKIMAGTWESSRDWWGIRTGIVDLAPFGPMVPQEVQDKVEAEKQRIINGEKSVFTGPIKDRDGNVKIPAGKTAADEDLLSMTWFVEGVEEAVD